MLPFLRTLLALGCAGAAYLVATVVFVVVSVSVGSPDLGEQEVSVGALVAGACAIAVLVVALRRLPRPRPRRL